MAVGLKASALLVGFLFSFLILFSSQSATAAATPSCSSDNCWGATGEAVYGQLGSYSSFSTQYVSYFNATTTGIVFMVVHNDLGQTVEISTSVLQLAALANGTAYTITFGLASGQYSASFFVTSPSGTAISATTATPFTVQV